MYITLEIPKVCIKCAEPKTVFDRWTEQCKGVSVTRVRNVCSDCQKANYNARRAARVAADPEPFRARSAAYHLKHREREKQRDRAQRVANPEAYRAKKTTYRIENRAKIRQWARAQKAASPAASMWHSAKYRARRDDLPFTITKADIIIPTHCPVLGMKLECGSGRPSDNSPSLDKIVPALGYVPGNIMVISYRANGIKSDATIAELRVVADFYGRLEAA